MSSEQRSIEKNSTISSDLVNKDVGLPDNEDAPAKDEFANDQEVRQMVEMEAELKVCLILIFLLHRFD